MLKVIKRNGQIVDFDANKIKEAVAKAYREVYPGMNDECVLEWKEFITEKVISNHYSKLDDNSQIDIENIQDNVEKCLMSLDKTVAKAYIIYRYQRAEVRDKYKDLMGLIREKLSAVNVQNQNANVDERSFGGRIGEITNAIMSQYALDYCMCEKSKNNHVNNRIYQHDLPIYAIGNHNCLSIPLDPLLEKGFDTRQTDVRPPQSVSTACQQVAVLDQLQSLQQFGGVSATHLDWTLVPFVKKSFYKHYQDGLKFIKRTDCTLLQVVKSLKIFKPIENLITKRISKSNENIAQINSQMDIENECYKVNKNIYKYAKHMTVKETYQAVEGLYHNLNTLQSRSGNQLPFTSINYGTCTSPEGRMVIRALIDMSIKGLGSKYRTPVFPCGIFQCMKGVNLEKGDPNYDLFRLALKSTSLRLYPNYANVDWSGNAGYDRNDPRTYFSTIHRFTE